MWEDDWFWSFYREEDELEEYRSQSELADDLYKAALIVLSLYVQNINEGKLADRSMMSPMPKSSMVSIRKGSIQYKGIKHN